MLKQALGASTQHRTAGYMAFLRKRCCKGEKRSTANQNAGSQHLAIFKGWKVKLSTFRAYPISTTSNMSFSFWWLVLSVWLGWSNRIPWLNSWIRSFPSSRPSLEKGRPHKHPFCSPNFSHKVAESCGVQRHQTCHKSHKSSLKSLSLGFFVGWIRFYYAVGSSMSSYVWRMSTQSPNQWTPTLSVQVTGSSRPNKRKASSSTYAFGRCQTSRGAICYVPTWKSSPKWVGCSLYLEPPAWEKCLMKSPSEKLWIESFSIRFKARRHLSESSRSHESSDPKGAWLLY